MNPDDIKIIGIELSTYCNLRCELCNGIDRTKSEFLRFEALENMDLDFFINGRVSFYGSGEPTLNPHIKDIISSIKNPVTFGTNGTTHNEHWWYDFAKILPDKHIITFGIDGTDQETYSYYRSGGNYNKVVNNMKAFISGGGKVWWQFIMFAHNEHQVKDAEILSKMYGCERFMILPSWVYNKKYQTPKTYKNKSEEQAQRPNLLCRICNGEIFVSVDGNYMPCCLTRDLSHVLRVTGCKPFKNAYKDSLLEVVKSNYYTDMLKRIPRIEKCRRCLIACGKRFSFNTSNIEQALS